MLQWGASWTPTDPIESMFFNLEELYIQAVIAEVPLYMQAQLLDQALDKIKKTGLFIQTIVTWNALLPNDKIGPISKFISLRPTTPILKVGYQRGQQDIIGQWPPLATAIVLGLFPTPSHK